MMTGNTVSSTVREITLFLSSLSLTIYVPDDLPVIKENLRKGFLETQSKVNSWVETFKKRLEGDDWDDERDREQASRQNYRQNQNGDGQTYRQRRSGEGRHSVDRERYDADHQVLGDDFSSLELRDNEGILSTTTTTTTTTTHTTNITNIQANHTNLAPPPRPPRPQANADLFSSQSAPRDRRKVSFQEGPPEEIKDQYSGGGASTESARKKSGKWQPLSTVEPSPMGDNDPFSLGDSDDEKEFKNKDVSKTDDGEGQRAATTTTTTSATTTTGGANESNNNGKTDKSNNESG